MSEKKYTIILVLAILVIVPSVLLLSHFLRSLDIPYRGVDTLRQYQVEKIESNSGVELIFLGDSSLGNAIDAEHFSELSELNTISLALTGSFGLTGTLNFMRYTDLKHESLHTVVIVNTLDIWRREFSEEGYVSTLYGMDDVSFEGVLNKGKKYSSFNHEYNPKEIYWYLRHLAFGIEKPKELHADYIKQSDKMFSNGKQELSSGTALDPKVSEEKVRVLKLIGEYCLNNELDCIYMHGPLHFEIVENSQSTIEKINNSVSNIEGINFIPKIFAYPADQLGDSSDHIAPQNKAKSTEDYFKVLEELLNK